jgi:FlaG/FlaF family flagellin (archaellin)
VNGPAEDAVSDTLGSILMVAVTMAVATVLGLMLLSFDGPTAQPHAQVAVSVDPGRGGWGTGDETVRLQHTGGDALPANLTAVVVTLDGAATRLTGSALGSTWSDGWLRIGETWVRSSSIPAGASLRVEVVATGERSVLLARSALVATSTAPASACATDAAPPTARWTQSPATLTSLTAGAVTVTAQLEDGCWGVNPGVAPSLFWRIVGAGTPPPFTDQGSMAPAGTGTWSGTIPAQSWSSLVGSRLEYYAGPLADLGGNVGDSAVQSSPVVDSCAGDNVAPAVASRTQSPSDVRSTTIGAVTVTVTVADNCAGVDQAAAPRLLYRIVSGTSPAFEDAGPMTLTAASTWRGTIPAQTWALLAGRVLEYQVASMRDLNGNVGSSAVYQDPIELVFTHTYVASNTPTAGTVSSFSNAQSATDLGAEAMVAESGTATPPATVRANANGVAASGRWSGSANGFASDNAYASFATNGPVPRDPLTGAYNDDLVYELQDPATAAGTVTQVVVHAEVSVSIVGNDGFRLYACLSGTISCTSASPMGGQSLLDTTLSYDITSLRPGGGAWSWSDLAKLQAAVTLVQTGSRDGTWRVDHVYATVTSVASIYTADVRLDWTGVPASADASLELRYRAVGDQFSVQAWDWVTNSYRTLLPSPALSSSSATVYVTPLGLTETSVTGAVRIRIVDASPAGTVQGILYLDYARVATT